MGVEILQPMRIVDRVRRFGWPAVLVVSSGILIGRLIPAILDAKLYQLLAVIGVMGGAVFIAVRPTFERIFHLLLLSLPLMTAFVINVGGFIRVSFLLTLLGLLAALTEGRLRIPKRCISVSLLNFFVFFSLISTVFTLGIPDLPTTVTLSGIRRPSVRSIIQAGQLLVMVGAFFLTLSYVRSKTDLQRVVTFILWGSLFATLYGFYEFFAAMFKIPFVDLNNAVMERGNLTAGYTVAGVFVVRPRSTFFEPIGLSTFLLFAGPLVLALAYAQPRRVLRWRMLLCCLGMVTLFVVANSRMALIGFILLLPLLFLLLGTWKARMSLLGGLVVVIATFAFVVGSSSQDLSRRLEFAGLIATDRLDSVINLRGRAEGNEEPYAEVKPIFADHPIMGVGIGNFPYYLSDPGRGGEIATSGSLYVQLLVEGGVVGTGIFLAFVGSILLGLLRVIRRTSDLVLYRFALASFTSIVTVVTTWIAVPGLYTDTYLWVMMALGVAIPRLCNKEGGGIVGGPAAHVYIR